MPDPGAGADHDRQVRAELLADRQVRVLVAVPGVGDEHVLAEPDVVADLDRGVRDDRDPRAEHAVRSPITRPRSGRSGSVGP